LKRRDLIVALAGAAALPHAVRAQQSLPVIGFLGSASTRELTAQLQAFREGLHETGFRDGQNVTIEWRWAGRQNGSPAGAGGRAGAPAGQRHRCRRQVSNGGEGCDRHQHDRRISHGRHLSGEF
jgi:hypothetical protein